MYPQMFYFNGQASLPRYFFRLTFGQGDGGQKTKKTARPTIKTRNKFVVSFRRGFFSIGDLRSPTVIHDVPFIRL